GREARAPHVGRRRDRAGLGQRLRFLDQLRRDAGSLGRRLPPRLALSDHPTTSLVSHDRYGSNPRSTRRASSSGTSYGCRSRTARHSASHLDTSVLSSTTTSLSSLTSPSQRDTQLPAGSSLPPPPPTSTAWPRGLTGEPVPI